MSLEAGPLPALTRASPWALNRPTQLPTTWGQQRLAAKFRELARLQPPHLLHHPRWVPLWVQRASGLSGARQANLSLQEPAAPGWGQLLTLSSPSLDLPLPMGALAQSDNPHPPRGLALCQACSWALPAKSP